MAGASKPGHDSKVAGASETGAKSTMAGARSSGKRVSQGRGGSASGRVWPMDPPELTEAISRCASLKAGAGEELERRSTCANLVVAGI
eukprot:scaffold67730_cov17-Tisochrysis_lutea.AAC.1